MPRVKFNYPSEDGHLAVSLKTLRAYCAERKLDQQAVLQKAIRLYFDGLRDDNGNLFPIADNRRKNADMPSDFSGLKALFAAHGLEVPKHPPVPRNDSIEVVFPEQEKEGELSLKTFLSQCRYIAEPPEELIQHAVWQLVVKQPD